MLCRYSWERLYWANILSNFWLARFWSATMHIYNKKERPVACFSQRDVVTPLEECIGIHKRSGRHLVNLSCFVTIFFCWKIRHLRIQTDEDGTMCSKPSIIDLELNRLNIDIETLIETWHLHWQLTSASRPLNRPEFRCRIALKRDLEAYKYKNLRGNVTGAFFLAISPTRQTKVLCPNLHHRL